MTSEDRGVAPETAPVWNHEHNMPYARRTVISVFMVVVIVLGFFFFLKWLSADREQANQLSDNRSVYTDRGLNSLENNEDVDEDKSIVYGFFHDFYEGMQDGVNDANERFSQVGHMGQNQRKVNSALQLQQYYKDHSSSHDDGYIHSIYDLVGSDVFGRDGREAGSLYDIIVNKETGEAKALVIDKDQMYAELDLKSIDFSNVVKQVPQGDARASLTDIKITQKPDFYYKAMDHKKYVSLRHLRNGQILDYQGKVAGQIDAVIYENAEVQKIYFRLKDNLVPPMKQDVFAIGFDAVKIVTNPDGYDIQLNKEQTRALAQQLYGSAE